MDDKPSGRFVEDVLYDWAVTQRSETFAHSFILDTDCQEVMDLFIMKYHKKNVGDLRQVVMTPYLKDGEIYNPKLHYDLEWIQINLLLNGNKDIEEARIGKSDGDSFASKTRKNKKEKSGNLLFVAERSIYY
ncbi:hypothetical protein GLOIN_2v1838532 [Rhizophagus clarus]|uniref:Uncharacterized protein n=1 Tax=Rhizophagus clarus TaxID=94130 RepID=A0A8H3QS42_9GLOM|nr:hypothetical protein GLOIN_2v1838532 [Rhizophagus clarus]